MIVNLFNAMCTGVIPPREWEMDGRTGTTFKVELSMGDGTMELQCSDEDIYNKFTAFERFDVELDLKQTNYEGRKGVKALIVYAEPAKA